MLNWLDNPLASYVLAAYGAAAAGLLLLLVASLYLWRQSTLEWNKLRTPKKSGDANE